MNYDRKQMKLSAKEAVKRTAPKAILVTLVFWLLTTALVEVIEHLVSNPFSSILSVMTTYPELVEENPELLLTMLSNVGGTAVITVFVSIVLSLYNMVMGYSYNSYALKVYRRENPTYGELFSAFPKAGTAIGSVIMTIIYSVLWVMLGVVGFAAVVGAGAWVLGDSWAIIPIYLVAYAALIVYLFWALYRYSMVPYYVMDQDMGVFEAIRASRDIMRGNKRKIFVLEISFIGWELLIALISGAVVLAGFALGGGLSNIWLLINGAADPNALLGSGVALSVAAVVAELVTLPLTLWLTAYASTAEAGFYVCLMEYNGQTNSATTWTPAEENHDTFGGADFSWKPTEDEKAEEEAQTEMQAPQAETDEAEAEPKMQEENNDEA